MECLYYEDLCHIVAGYLRCDLETSDLMFFWPCIVNWLYIYIYIRGLLEKYPTFGREKETGLPGALDT